MYNVSKITFFISFLLMTIPDQLQVLAFLSFQGYGDNLKTFRDQVMKQPERLLFSNERLNKVIFRDSEKV